MTDEKRRSWGEGEVFRPTYRDKKTGEQKESANLWIRYRDAQGDRVKEPAETTNEREAEALLHSRVALARNGAPVGPVVTKTTFEDLEKLIVLDYSVNKREESRLQRSLKHLRRAWGPKTLATSIQEERIDRYRAYRLESGAANATINREMATLKRMFRLGARARRIGRVPYIAMLTEDNRRKGFLEPAQFRSVREHLSPVLQTLVDVAYITGWRVRSEILTRQWHHVDFGPAVWGCHCGDSHRDDACETCGKARPGWLRLDPGEGKNKEARMFPLTPELRAALQLQRDRTDALEQTVEFQRDDRVMPWVFWRMRSSGVAKDGSPISCWRRAWGRACLDAGFGELQKRKGKKSLILTTRIPHDFRRTAVRNLEQAGVDRSTARALVGHKTDSIYTRYAIVDVQMAQRGGEKLSRLHQEQATTKNVTQFKKRGGEKA